MIGIGAHKRKPHEVDLGSKGSFEIKHPGGLHKALGIPFSENIPASEKEPHSGDSPHLAEMRRSAKGFSKMKH